MVMVATCHLHAIHVWLALLLAYYFKLYSCLACCLESGLPVLVLSGPETAESPAGGGPP
eukprot:SAG31_NODE_30653_length_378_cov_0.720430_2_plen_58_part_01